METSHIANSAALLVKRAVATAGFAGPAGRRPAGQRGRCARHQDAVTAALGNPWVPSRRLRRPLEANAGIIYADTVILSPARIPQPTVPQCRRGCRSRVTVPLDLPARATPYSRD